MPDINIGVPTNFATPGDFPDHFGVGPGGSDPGTYAILIIGNKTSAGTGTVDTVVYGPTSSQALQNETDMIALGGTGCEAHRLWLRARKVLDLAATVGVVAPPVYVIFPTESAGTGVSRSRSPRRHTAAGVLPLLHGRRVRRPFDRLESVATISETRHCDQQ
jgi:hypothetical protein